MSAGLAYALGVATPFVALMAFAAWDWGLEGLDRWWRTKRPTLGRLRCTLTGHAFGGLDRGWIVCHRCGHARLLHEQESSS